MKIDGKKWKLVPVAATDKMVAAGWSAPPDDRGRWDTERERNHVLFGPAYRAMLAAAPSLDIEALVESVAKAYMRAAHEVKPVDLGGLDLDQVINDAWADMTADKSGVEHIARAVLRHLFGEG